jgi:hypothetical protein
LVLWLDRLKAFEVLSFIKSALFLQRAALLLTVWSNCLAGWWLGGGDRYQELPFLLSGSALLFVGGTLWGDPFAIGLGFEERSNPAPTVRLGLFSTGQSWGLGLLMLGVLALAWCGTVAAGIGLALAGVIVFAHVMRSVAALSVVVPALCRVLFYLTGAAAGVLGITGSPIWCGLVLAAYVVGVGFLPRQGKAFGPERYWPVALIAVPIVFTMIKNDGDSRNSGLLLSAVVALWSARSLRPALWSEERDFGKAVTGLVGGIALVDLLAVADAPRQIGAVFLTLFLMTRALQTVASQR